MLVSARSVRLGLLEVMAAPRALGISALAIAGILLLVACGGNGNGGASGTADITEIINFSGDGVGNALDSPQGITVDATGNVYIASGTSSVSFYVMEVTSDGVISEIARAIGEDGDGSCAFEKSNQDVNVHNPLCGPRSVALDPSGNVYVAAALSNNVFKIVPGGAVTEILDATGDGTGSPTTNGFCTQSDINNDNPLCAPVGIAVDSSSNVYVVGFLSHNAFRMAPGELAVQIIDTTGDGGGNTLVSPIAIAVDGTSGATSGNVYVAGNASDNVFEITPGGAITQIIDGTGDGAGNTLELPRALVVDASGNVFVAGNDSNNVFKITPDGSITEIIDTTGDGAGNLLLAPRSIAVAPGGNVYVAGHNSNNVFEITPAGTITEVIDASGAGGEGELLAPRGVAIDAQGNLYVAGDFSDNVLRLAL